MDLELRKACFGGPLTLGDTSFVFQLNHTVGAESSGLQEDLFGIVVVSREPLLWREGGCVMTTPRAYCFLSKWPLFDRHREAAAQIGQQMAGLQFECMEAQRATGSGWCTSPIRDQIQALEQLLREYDLETESAQVRAAVGYCAGSLPQAIFNNVTQWACSLLLSNVDQPHLQSILSCVLLEEQVILTSSEVSKVSACALAIGCMISPLRVAGVHMPVLPLPALQDVIEAPIPYLVGIVKRGVENHRFPDGVVVVDLDQRGAGVGFGVNGFRSLFCRPSEWPKSQRDSAERVVWAVGAAISEMILSLQQSISSNNQDGSFLSRFRQTQMFEVFQTGEEDRLSADLR
eukprot:TRINITY_DN11886_c0_g1_i1.p1 TRINITY_DN11886_c0_g1~~TRINITY_DN11886_c0_g1_i1.p1  ORF type:complete len:346 (-),score=76.72 TRINITY_DN11886_c0_g1_i1:5-1042(-)